MGKPRKRKVYDFSSLFVFVYDLHFNRCLSICYATVMFVCRNIYGGRCTAPREYTTRTGGATDSGEIDSYLLNCNNQHRLLGAVAVAVAVYNWSERSLIPSPKSPR